MLCGNYYLCNVKLLWVSILLLFLPCGARAETTFSLLTCYPGNEIYSIYGHTAIRMVDDEADEDLTFNYGVFNFRQKNFALNFALGKTDYELGVVKYEYFRQEYERTGRKTIEQVLNLTSAQKQSLKEALLENWQPENSRYRYNFFYDNCTTRARNIIFSVLNTDSSQVMTLHEDKPALTWRQNLHLFTEKYPWYELADDICLGVDADRLMTADERQFLPLNLMADMEITEAVADSVAAPLVWETKTLIDVSAKGQWSGLFTPLFSVGVLALIIILLSVIEIRLGKILWGVDVALLAAVGVAGCVLVLIASGEHPCVFPNLNLLLFCPLAWVVMVMDIRACRKRKVSRTWLWFLLVCLALIIADISKLQDIPLFSEILASLLLLRPVNRIIVFRKQKK